MEAVTGVDATRATLETFVTSSDEIDWVIHHQVAVGDVVMNERTDRFRTGDNGSRSPSPACGRSTMDASRCGATTSTCRAS